MPRFLGGDGREDRFDSSPQIGRHLAFGARQEINELIGDDRIAAVMRGVIVFNGNPLPVALHRTNRQVIGCDIPADLSIGAANMDGSGRARLPHGHGEAGRDA